MDNKFTLQLIELGILKYKDQQTIFQIARHCASTTGIPMAASGALLAAKAGTVMVPGVGAIPGALAGALAGMFAGTVSCTLMNVSMKEQLKNIIEGK